MPEKLINKKKVLEPIRTTRLEMTDVIEALDNYATAIEAEDFPGADTAYKGIAEHVGGGQYTKHIQFNEPEAYELEEEE